MKLFSATHIDFAQPPPSFTRPWVLLIAALVALVLALGLLGIGAQAFRQTAWPSWPVPASGRPASEPAADSPADALIVSALTTDFAIFERSLERQLPAGVELVALSASQDTQRITLLARAPSAQALVALPRWLAADQAHAPWRIERITRASDRSTHYTATFSCNGCWRAPDKKAGPVPSTATPAPAPSPTDAALPAGPGAIHANSQGHRPQNVPE